MSRTEWWLGAALLAGSSIACESVEPGATIDAGGTSPDAGSLPDGGAGLDGGVTPDAGPLSDAGSSERGLSSGCGNERAGRGLQRRTIEIAGVERSYLRFIPDDYDPDAPLALVFALHGSGGTSERARSAFDLERVAGGGAIFVYPQALPSPDPAFDGANRWDPARESDDFAFLDSLGREVEASHCVDRDRIFAVGFSLGARFTANLGCWRGDVLRAIAPIAPGGNEVALPLDACVDEVGVWEGLGLRDVDHEEGATRVREHYRAANGCGTTTAPTTPEGCEAYEGCRASAPLVYCTYDLGHEIPPIAPRGVWSFFRRFD
jgi:polyhydroxybutyrate depolymerase